MTRITTLGLTARCTRLGPRLNFWFDACLVGTMQPCLEPQSFQFEFSDQEAIHVFEIEMSGKQPGDTVLDVEGNIIQDVMIEITDFKLDNTDLGKILHKKCRYHHDHNGTSALTDTAFFGNMGCNGRVILEFASPVYLWMLEQR